MNSDSLISLTYLWKLAGKNPHQHPKFWRKQAHTAAFIEKVSKGVEITTPITTQVGKGKPQGTYAHWQIALAYAKYLSPELHMAVNEVYQEIGWLSLFIFFP